MWGDAQFINGAPASPTAPTGIVVTGADTFVFAPANGTDFIYDFRQSDHDRIDVSAYGFNTLADMLITDMGDDTTIGFDATNSVTLIGFGDPSVLQASDFRGIASFAFFSIKVNTPSSSWAAICCWSILFDSVNERAKWPTLYSV